MLLPASAARSDTSSPSSQALPPTLMTFAVRPYVWHPVLRPPFTWMSHSPPDAAPPTDALFAFIQASAKNADWLLTRMSSPVVMRPLSDTVDSAMSDRRAHALTPVPNPPAFVSDRPLP